MKKQTLAELGFNLPVLPSTSWGSRAFSFITWGMKEEKLIAEAKRGIRVPGLYVSKIFDLMLETLGSRDWQATKKDDNDKSRLLVLNQMPYGNMLYMFICLRRKAMGKHMRITGLKCPACNKKIDEFIGDLDTLEVDVREDGEDAQSCYALENPIKIGDALVTGVWVKDTPWEVMEKMTPAEAESGSYKQHWVERSAVAFQTDVEPRAELSASLVMQKLSKLDLEGLFGFLEESNGGPRMALEVVCDDCSHKFFRALDWNFESFFGNSSLPKKKSKSGRSSSSSATGSQESPTATPSA